MEEAAAVAEDAVRDELGEVERLGRAQHPPAQEVQPSLRVHAHPAPQLVLGLARSLLEGEGFRLVDGPAATLSHQVGEAEVVPEARVALAVVLRGEPRRWRRSRP